MASLGIKAGDEVILPDVSCVATALPVLYTGAKPIFADVDPSTWNICPESIKKCLTSKTKAIMTVHWNGHPCKMSEIQKIADQFSLPIVEDCAAALGATYKGKLVGTFGKCSAVSFQGAKIAIGGQGGAFFTNFDDVYNKAKILASYGRTDSRMMYWSDYVGYNYGLANLPAALAKAQLDRIEDLLSKKRLIWSWYKKYGSNLKNLNLIDASNDSLSTYCYPPALLSNSSKIKRDELIEELQKNNIDARPAQPRQSQMPMFSHKPHNIYSKEVEERGILLPGAFCLEEEDVKFVCDFINKII